MISVLCYPNITYQRNLQADSYVVAVGGMIRALNEVRDDLEFTMLMPHPVPSLALPNVRQVTYPLPSYPNTMRAHFDTEAFLRAVSWKDQSYDVVWSHLPEHTAQIKNVFYNATNERPVFVGYCHWFEVPENTSYLENLLMHNLAGVLSMEECAVNSEWLRGLVLHHAARIYSPETFDDLAFRLRVQYLGTDGIDPPSRLEPEKGLLVFNHRPNEYTGFTQTLKVLDDLWKERQDFRLLLTIADADRPYIEKVATPDRGEYLRQLSRAWAGIGAFRKYSAWSVSTTDGMSMGVPYVLPNALAYPEMVGPGYDWLYEPGQLKAAITRVLDHPSNRPAMSLQASVIARDMEWANRVDPISAMFDRAIEALPTVKATDSYDKALGLAREGISKRELLSAMGWGVRVPWTGYRNRLRQDGVEIGADWYGEARQQVLL